MVSQRTVKDHLRSEYAALLPVMQRALIAIETEIRHALLTPILNLLPHERIIVRTRIKDCESAVEALKRRQPYSKFDPARPPESFSLTTLPDLVGVRVLCFPRRRLEEVREMLSLRLTGWRPDHVAGEGPDGEPIALKYDGRWRAEDPFSCEIQIVSLLVGLFWDVEHWAIYKPRPNRRPAAESLVMKEMTAAVVSALDAFERQFEHEVESADHSFPTGDEG